MDLLDRVRYVLGIGSHEACSPWKGAGLLALALPVFLCVKAVTPVPVAQASELSREAGDSEESEISVDKAPITFVAFRDRRSSARRHDRDNDQQRRYRGRSPGRSGGRPGQHLRRPRGGRESPSRGRGIQRGPSRGRLFGRRPSPGRSGARGLPSRGRGIQRGPSGRPSIGRPSSPRRPEPRRSPFRAPSTRRPDRSERFDRPGGQRRSPFGILCLSRRARAISRFLSIKLS